MQFWAKKLVNWEKDEVKFLKFLRTKLSWEAGSGQKSGDDGQLGGRAKFSLPGESPSPHQVKTLPLQKLQQQQNIYRGFLLSSLFLQTAWYIVFRIHDHTDTNTSTMQNQMTHLFIIKVLLVTNGYF